MEKYVFTIRGRWTDRHYCFPSLNQYLNMVGKTRDRGNAFKQKYENLTVQAIRREYPKAKIEGQVIIHYVFGEPDRKRDVSNVVSCAVKFIEDGMQKCHFIKNDSPAFIKDYTHQIVYIKKDEFPFIRVEVTVI